MNASPTLLVGTLLSHIGSEQGISVCFSYRIHDGKHSLTFVNNH